MTDFSVVYENFLSKITDDMYMELTVEETEEMLVSLLLDALPHFEFPRQNIFDYDIETETFSVDLTNEEGNILGTYMVVEWMSQQLASVENTRMKYSGSDFKFTSQANHMSKILTVKKDYERLGFHLQRLYKRRKADEKGMTFSSYMVDCALHGSNGITPQIAVKMQEMVNIVNDIADSLDEKDYTCREELRQKANDFDGLVTPVSPQEKLNKLENQMGLFVEGGYDIWESLK